MASQTLRKSLQRCGKGRCVILCWTSIEIQASVRISLLSNQWGTPPSLTLILVITAIWLDFSPATVQGRYRDRNQAAVLAIFLVALDFNGSVNDVSLCNLETQWPKIAWSRPIGVANSLVCSKYMFTHVVPPSQRRTKTTTGSNGCHCLPWQGDVSQAKQTSLDWTTRRKQNTGKKEQSDCLVDDMNIWFIDGSKHLQLHKAQVLHYNSATHHQKVAWSDSNQQAHTHQY